jgi:O-antigen/teichoic acid export membrane protein
VGVLAMAATWAVILVTYDVKNARRTLAEVRIGEGGDPASSRRLAPLFDSSLLARLAWLALPMGGVMALISLRSNLPRYFIEKCWGEATLGIFAAIAYLIFAGDTLVVAMGQSVVSRLSVHYANGNMRQYKRVLLSLVGIAGGVGIVGIAAAAFAGPFILSLLYRPEYVVQTKVFTGLMIVGALMYLSSSLSQGVMAARCFKILFPIVLVSTALTAGGSWLWIPKYGLLGAVGALALGGVAQLLGNAGGVLYALRSKSREIPTHVP